MRKNVSANIFENRVVIYSTMKDVVGVISIKRIEEYCYGGTQVKSYLQGLS